MFTRGRDSHKTSTFWNSIAHLSLLEFLKHLKIWYTIAMKLIAQVKLKPTAEQAQALEKTMRQVNAACNYISDLAWDEKVFGRRTLRDRVYLEVREKFGLGAQIAQHAAFKVADAYKIDKDTKREFRPLGSVTYDPRILSWATDKQFVSIWTVDGRIRIPFVIGEHQGRLLEFAQGEADLICRQGGFYIHQTCDIEEPDPSDPDGWLGIDMGETNIAVTSDGDISTSQVVEKNRQRHHRAQWAPGKELQSKGTKSTRRKLKQLRSKQSRFQKDINHQISKRLVSNAARTKRGIAVEHLTDIRAQGAPGTRVKGKENRAKRSNWSFAQLRMFLEYKAKLTAVPFGVVDPAYTSQRCFECGHIEASNRKSQSEFLCKACGHTAHADVNAAKNISGLMSISLMSPLLLKRRLPTYRTVEPGTSPRILVVGN